MGDQQEPGPWDPFDLITDEHKSILETSQGIDQAQDRIHTLAIKLAYDEPLSKQETQWLINLAFTAANGLWWQAKHEEYNQQQRQEQSQRVDELLNAPVELPPYQPSPLPEWLQALQQQEGG